MRNEPCAASPSPTLLDDEAAPSADPASGIPDSVPHTEANDGIWIVTFDCQSDVRDPDLDETLIEVLADELLDHLPPYSRPVISAVGTTLRLTFQVTANASTAIPIGVDHTWTALEAADLSDYQITRAAQISLREHQRQTSAGQPRRLHLLNASECARELEITRQRVAQLIDAGDFPEPAGMIGKRSVWSETDILTYKTRRGGR